MCFFLVFSVVNAAVLLFVLSLILPGNIAVVYKVSNDNRIYRKTNYWFSDAYSESKASRRSVRMEMRIGFLEMNKRLVQLENFGLIEIENFVNVRYSFFL